MRVAGNQSAHDRDHVAGQLFGALHVTHNGQVQVEFRLDLVGDAGGQVVQDDALLALVNLPLVIGIELVHSVDFLEIRAVGLLGLGQTLQELGALVVAEPLFLLLVQDDDVQRYEMESLQLRPGAGRIHQADHVVAVGARAADGEFARQQGAGVSVPLQGRPQFLRCRQPDFHGASRHVEHERRLPFLPVEIRGNAVVLAAGDAAAHGDAADDVGLNILEGLEKFFPVMGSQMLERLVIEGVHARDRIPRHLGLEL